MPELETEDCSEVSNSAIFQGKAIQLQIEVRPLSLPLTSKLLHSTLPGKGLLSIRTEKKVTSKSKKKDQISVHLEISAKKLSSLPKNIINSASDSVFFKTNQKLTFFGQFNKQLCKITSLSKKITSLLQKLQA